MRGHDWVTLTGKENHSLMQPEAWDDMQGRQEENSKTWEKMGVEEWMVGGSLQRIL